MKKRKPEVTSARVAKIAARVLGTDGDFGTLTWSDGHDLKFRLHWDDLRAVCGSALTQTADRTKPKRTLNQRLGDIITCALQTPDRPKPKKYGPLVLRPGITAEERKRAKALIAASAKKPKKRVRK